MRVLLVDDELELVSAMSERLQLRGIEATFATRGTEALDIVRVQSFDVVLLDVKMPGLSGVKLMRQIDELRPGMKYIFLTGHGSEEDYNACSEAGACSYLIKPVKLDDIISKLREAVQ